MLNSDIYTINYYKKTKQNKGNSFSVSYIVINFITVLSDNKNGEFNEELYLRIYVFNLTCSTFTGPAIDGFLKA